MSVCPRSKEPLFFCTFPCGIEDVVRHDLQTIFGHVQTSTSRSDSELVVVSQHAKKHELAERVRSRFFKKAEQREDRLDTRTNAPQWKSQSQEGNECETVLLRPRPKSVEDAICTVRGALFFSLLFPSSPWTSCDTAFARSFLDVCVRCQRSLDRMCVHLVSAPCVTDLCELDQVLWDKKEDIREAVLEHVGHLAPYLQTWGTTGEPLQLTASRIVYRVNAFRQDKSVTNAFTSQDLAAHVGGLLNDLFEPEGWRVNMLYYNIEFFALYDQQHVHLGVCLTPPALPRCGDVLDVEAQLAMEYLRQRICTDIAAAHASDSEATGRQLKGLVPRPGSHRQEVRAVKGQNAMHSALAAALVTYADVQPFMCVGDPFCGSGSILVESILRQWTHLAWTSDGTAATKPATTSASSASRFYMGSDICARDVRNAQKNIDPLTLLRVSTLLSIAPATGEGNEQEKESLTSCVRRYKAAMQHVVQSINYKTELEPTTLMESLRRRLDADTPTQECRAALQDTLKKKDKLPRGGCPSSSYSSLCLQADATCLPLCANSLDRIVSDLPFGRRCGNHAVNRKLYPAILRACYRVLRDPSEMYTAGEASSALGGVVEGGEGNRWWSHQHAVTASHYRDGGRAVLLTVEGALMSEVLHAYFHEFPFFLVTKPFTVDMGGLFPYVFVLDKLRLPS